MRRKICMFWIVFSCLALCFVSLIGVFSQIQQSEPTLASYSATPIVIIDAGEWMEAPWGSMVKLKRKSIFLLH